METLKISEITIPLDKFRNEHPNVENLKKSITKLGLLQPVGIVEKDGKHILRWGLGRFLAMRELGYKEVPVVIHKFDNKGLERLAEIHENSIRADLTWQQDCQATKSWDEICREIYGSAPEQGGRPKKNRSESDQLWSTAKTAECLYKAHGVAIEEIQLAKALDDPAIPEGIKTARTKEIALRKLKELKQIPEIMNLTPPTGEFNVIVVDPPWKPTIEYDSEGWRGEGNYPKMSMEEIKNIKLPTAKDCILWLWSIDYFIKDALEIIEHWGFERKSTLIWDKGSMGLGHWLRLEHEYCFLAIKGKPKFFGENAHSVLHAPRTKNHSEKPEEFYKLVEETCKYPKKLDYFARKKREGWSVYGDEV